MSPPSGSERCTLSIWTNFKLSRITLCGSRRTTTKFPQCPTSEPRVWYSHWESTWNCAHNSSSQAQSNPLTSVISAQTSFTQGNTQVSYQRTLRGFRVRGDDPIAPTVIFGGVLGEGTYPLVRGLLRALMIEEIVLSQSPNTVLYAPTSGPSRTAAAPVLRTGQLSASSGYSATFTP